MIEAPHLLVMETLRQHESSATPATGDFAKDQLARTLNLEDLSFALKDNGNGLLLAVVHVLDGWCLSPRGAAFAS